MSASDTKRLSVASLSQNRDQFTPLTGPRSRLLTVSQLIGCFQIWDNLLAQRDLQRRTMQSTASCRMTISPVRNLPIHCGQEMIADLLHPATSAVRKCQTEPAATW